ncbi:endonuclease III [Candidatus Woesearchaeota archaeon]|nr:endonuclease III [Candidatus Woesearchaeota archaeon]
MTRKPSVPDVAATLRILSKQQGNTMLGKMSAKYDPFKILISTILSARCRDEVTEVIADNLFKKYPTAKALAKAKPATVKRLIRSIGFFNAKTKAIITAARQVVEQYHSRVPNDMESLLQLRGVGRKVAGCVLVYAYGKDAIPVDIHVHRISNRLGWVKTKTPEKTEQALMKLIPKRYWQVVNDTLVSHGKTICTPGIPKCSICPVFDYCRRVGVKRWK